MILCKNFRFLRKIYTAGCGDIRQEDDEFEVILDGLHSKFQVNLSYLVTSCQKGGRKGNRSHGGRHGDIPTSLSQAQFKADLEIFGSLARCVELPSLVLALLFHHPYLVGK